MRQRHGEHDGSTLTVALVQGDVVDRQRRKRGSRWRGESHAAEEEKGNPLKDLRHVPSEPSALGPSRGPDNVGAKLRYIVPPTWRIRQPGGRGAVGAVSWSLR